MVCQTISMGETRRWRESGPWTKVDEIFIILVEENLKIPKILKFQKGENCDNRAVESNNSRGGNLRGRGGRRVVDKSNMQYYNCQKLGNFAKECNSNKKEPQEDEGKVVRQEFDDEVTLLVMTTEGECISSRL